MPHEVRCRHWLVALVTVAVLGGCTSVTHLRDPKTGQAVTCGGEMWKPTAAAQDEHCLDYWQKMGYLLTP